jgi:hypothetical protein
VAGTNTYTSILGDYHKIGNRVTVRVRFTLTNLASTGNMRISGLPFTARYILGGGTAGVAAAAVLASYSNCNFTATPMVTITSNTSEARFHTLGLTGSSAVTDAQLTNTSSIQFQITYITND